MDYFKGYFRNSIFPVRFEILNLGIPIVFVIISIYMGFDASYAFSEKLSWRFVANMIFANSFHVCFTFWNLFYMKEFKNVSKAVSLTPMRVGGLLLLVGFIFACFHDDGFIKGDSIFRYLTIISICYFPLHHMARQSLGMSFLYNSNFRNKLSPDQLGNFSNYDTANRKMEHISSYIFIFSGFLMALSFRRGLFGFIPTQTIQNAAIAVVIVGIGFYLRSLWCFRNYRELLLIKGTFGVRHALRAMAPFSFLSRLLLAAVHGFEYTLIQHKMMKRSFDKRGLTIMILIPLAAFILFKVLLDIVQVLDHNTIITDVTFLKIMSITSATLTYVHYYLDSVFFKMRNPVIRNEMAPLLLKEAS